MQHDHKVKSGDKHKLVGIFFSCNDDKIEMTARELSARLTVALIVSSFLSNVLARIGRWISVLTQ
jgi:hypothetical protein